MVPDAEQSALTSGSLPDVSMVAVIFIIDEFVKSRSTFYFLALPGFIC
jgi:hypothetical protein